MTLLIPILYIKDKQVFAKEGGMLRLMGKPIDVVKKLQKKGFKLVHFVDSDALVGITTNMDTYDALTYFINIQVECAPNPVFIKKLLSIKCRVVLPAEHLPSEKNKLLVGKVRKGYDGKAEGFGDVIIDHDPSLVQKFIKLGKRVIVFEGSKNYSKECSKEIWGLLLSEKSAFDSS